MRHRRIIGCVAVGLGLGVALFSGAPPAVAEDTVNFLYDVRNNGGISGSDGALIQLGRTACNKKDQGASPAETVNAISGQAGLDSSNAQFIYESALIYMC